MFYRRLLDGLGMHIVTPANPIKVYMRQGEIGDSEYLASNVVFIIVESHSHGFDLTYVTISGTQIRDSDVAFARVLIDGQWVSHD
jgi:hypothetical protein